MSKKHNSNSGSRISRREAVKRGLVCTAGLWLTDRWGFAAPTVEPAKAKAKSVIQIWMWGGPTHLDTFDPKPDAGYEYTGALKAAIPTKVDGIQLG